MESELPKSLAEAMASEPLWLRTWIQVLIVANLGAALFVVGRPDGRWRVRPEPIAILLAFAAAGIAMGALYEQVGYVRLLGLTHLVFWGPAFAWILLARRRLHPRRSPFGAYLRFYLVVAGISLAIDAVDVARYLAGDGELWGR